MSPGSITILLKREGADNRWCLFFVAQNMVSALSKNHCPQECLNCLLVWMLVETFSYEKLFLKGTGLSESGCRVLNQKMKSKIFRGFSLKKEL